MKKHLWNGFISVVKRDVVPALGCTEPVSVALAAAIAMEKLKQRGVTQIDAIRAQVSPNLMKNGMGVGVPGTGMVGLPIAAAVGAIAGDSKAQLEVLKNITEQDVKLGKALIDNGNVAVTVADVTNILYAKATLYSGEHFVSVTIADSHTQVIAIEEDGITTFTAQKDVSAQKASADENPFIEAIAEDIYDFAMNAPLEDIRFIEQAYELNDALSIEGLTGKYGLQIGATFQRNVDRGLLSGGLLTEVLCRTSAASDARMDGT